MDWSQFAAYTLMGVIGLITLGGIVGTVGAFLTLGRSGYRKD